MDIQLHAVQAPGMLPGAAGIRSGPDTYEIIARQINKKKEKSPGTHSYRTSSTSIYVPLFSSARKKSD